MLDVGVYAAVADEAEKVDGFARRAGVVEGFEQGLILVQFAVAHGFVDAGEFLPHDAPGSNVEVADLGVAHLAFGQAHVFTEGDEGAVGIVRPEAVEVGGVGLVNRIGAVLWAEAPAVEDEEEGFFCHGGISCVYDLMRLTTLLILGSKWSPLMSITNRLSNVVIIKGNCLRPDFNRSNSLLR